MNGHPPPLPGDIRATIIICTRDRLALLRDTVAACLVQMAPYPGIDLLVVDNASQDGTAAALAALARDHPRLRVVCEERVGIYFARRRAILQTADARFLLWLDDDVIPGAGWLEGLLGELLADPGLGMVGSAIDPLWEGPPGEGPPAEWLSPRMLKDVPVLSFPDGRQRWRYPCYPPGLSLAMRRVPCLDLYCGEDRMAHPLGLRAGTPLARTILGEDLDLGELFLRAGYRAESVDHVRAGHRVLAHKLTPRWLIDKHYSDGRMRVRFARLTGRRPWRARGLPLILLAWPLTLLAQLGRPLMSRRLAVEWAARFAKSSGAWSELLAGPRVAPYVYPPAQAIPPLGGLLPARVAGMTRARRLLAPLAHLTARPLPADGWGASVRRIGVLLQWGIGDAVLALPLLHGLHDAFPDAVIEPIGKPFLAGLLGGEPGIGRCHTLVPPWTASRGKYRLWQAAWRRYAVALAGLRRQPFDLLVAPRCDPRDAVQARLIPARAAAGYAAAGGAPWYTHPFSPPLARALTWHRADAAAFLAEAVTGLPIDPQPRFRTAVDPAVALARIAAAGYRQGPILAVAPAAGHLLRRWPAGRLGPVLSALRDELGFILLIRELGDTTPLPPVPDGVPHLLWESDLAGLKGALAAADALLCVDSGVMHMAVALGRPVAALFGPADPAFFGPRGEGHQVIAIDVPCRPCFDVCSQPRPLCLDGIENAAVVRAVREALGGRPRLP